MNQTHLLTPHLRKQGSAQQLIVDGKPVIMLGGELHNSSASSLAYLDPIWDRLAAMHLNTVIAPLYWELVEPEEGRFDFALLDGMIEGARRRELRLVLLWFATWKNATSSYVPRWVKADPIRFPRLQLEAGLDANAISCFSDNACVRDARAFAAVMERIRQIDAAHHTVLMMQVENEAGVLGASRDHSPMAEMAYQQPVPKQLIAHLQTHQEALVPQMRQAWESAGARASGSWAEVFGTDADEVFMAWHIGRYVDRVAAAGKAAYDLPMVANAWLKVEADQPAGYYPSGGPVFTMLDVWRASAPHIDVLAPDIYAEDLRRVCAQYARPDNPLFIPEARRDARAASAVFYVLGQHDALGFAPFGVDSIGPSDGTAEPHPLSDSYALLAEMMPLLAEAQGMGRTVGLFQQEPSEGWEVELGPYWLRAQTMPHADNAPPAGGLVIALGEDEFLAVGRSLSIEFGTVPGRTNIEFLWLEEGKFQDGTWVRGRRLNGDETNHGRTVKLRDKLSTCRLKLNTNVMPIQHQVRKENP